MGLVTKTVRKLIVGDIIITSTFDKLRPLLILKLTNNFAYGVPLSTQQDELGFTNAGLNACRFLDPNLKQYVHPIIHRIGSQWGRKNWIGQVNPASVIKIRKQVKEILNIEILR